MSTTEIDTNLCFRVTITRTPGETWPVLTAGSQRWDVTEVEILVIYQNGMLAAESPYVRRARRIRKDGSPGASIQGSWTVYHGGYDPDEDSAADEQSDLLRQAALSAAQNAFCRLTRQHIPAYS